MASRRPARFDRVREFTHMRGANHIDYYVAPSKKFKSIILRAVLTLPMNKRHAAQGALLPHLLRRATAKHPNIALLSRYCEELYGTTVKADVRRLGRLQQLSISMRCPSPRYLGRGDFEKIADLLYEVLCEPLVEGKAFSQTVFESEREQLLNDIRGQLDARSEYAIRKAVEASFPAGSPYGIPDYGSERDVEELDNRALFAFYRSLLARAPLAFYVSGDVNAQTCIALLSKRFSDMARTRPNALPKNEVAPAPRAVRSKGEKHKIEQSFVVLTHATGINVVSREFAALQYADAIFGRMQASRLFRVVREQHGLAYSVGSFVSSATGLSVAYAGVEPEHAGEVQRLVRHELERLKKSGFDQKEFSAARNMVIEDYLIDQDSPGAPISSLLVQQSVGHVLSAAEEYRRLRAVKPADVRAVLAHYRPCAVYRLGP
ncbi:MAG: insulinase family protein [Planctomycetes bacterium]|nr:insulinase family protein [Planctomycetota bacterium]NUQ34541.1 insulinase family protein [Planctomycetaceae bacterium]